MPDPWLLTPGPLTTTRTVKEAMLRDYGSRDGAFIALNQRLRARHHRHRRHHRQLSVSDRGRPVIAGGPAPC